MLAFPASALNEGGAVEPSGQLVYGSELVSPCADVRAPPCTACDEILFDDISSSVVEPRAPPITVSTNRANQLTFERSVILEDRDA